MNKTPKIFFVCFSALLLVVGCAKDEKQPSIIVDNAISADGVSIARCKFEILANLR